MCGLIHFTADLVAPAFLPQAFIRDVVGMRKSKCFSIDAHIDILYEEIDSVFVSDGKFKKVIIHR